MKSCGIKSRENKKKILKVDTKKNMESRFKYIDIHTHINLAVFNDDWEETVERTRESGVAHINVGTQIDTSKRAVDIAEQYEDGVYATVGIHPIHTSKTYRDEEELGPEHADGKGFTSRDEELDIETYRTLAQNKKVVAIGECGLDYFRADKEKKERQTGEFIKQIELANELNKPLMLHTRPSEGSQDAYEDCLEILKEHATVKGNAHFFAGNLDTAKKFWELGFTTSFTGVITFADQYDEIIKNAPLDMIHAETDAPYVTPAPHRGKRNEPLYVKEVYKRIAELRGEDKEEVRVKLFKNAERLFGIKF
jgi:TatD DNase family protein